MTDEDPWLKEIQTIAPLKKRRKTVDQLNKSKTRPIQNIIPSPKIHVNHTFFDVDEVGPKYFKKQFIQATIDLHGYTREEAGSKLEAFFKIAQIRQYKMVLVITGKGKTSGDDMEIGIIRKYTMEWFKAHSQYIVSYSTAEQKDGGDGAFYAYVRKLRT